MAVGLGHGLFALPRCTHEFVDSNFGIYIILDEQTNLFIAHYLFIPSRRPGSYNTDDMTTGTTKQA